VAESPTAGSASARSPAPVGGRRLRSSGPSDLLEPGLDCEFWRIWFGLTARNPRAGRRHGSGKGANLRPTPCVFFVVSQNPRVTSEGSGSGRTPANSDPPPIDEKHPGAHPFRVWPLVERSRWQQITGSARAWLPRVLMITAAVVASIGLLYIVIAVLPSQLIGSGLTGREARARAESEMRGALLQALGGFVLLVGLYYTARSFRASRDAQITERYSRAVSQLSEKSLAVRLGAVLALERIWRDSPQDYLPILEVLLAFLRTRAPRTAPAKYKQVPRDVQAVVSVLGRRPYPRKERRKLALDELDLSGADFMEGNFPYTDFSYSKLDQANMRNADLRGASFFSASLVGTGLIGVHLQEAFLPQADLTGAFLCESDLRNSNLTEVNLTMADLGCRYGPFGEIDTKPARLSGCYVEDALMTRTRFIGTDLTRVVGLTEKQILSSHFDDTTNLPEPLAHLTSAGSDDGRR